MRGSRLVLMMLVAAALVALMAGGATGQQAANGPSQPAAAPEPEQIPADVREREARRRADRGTAAARRARAESRRRYSGQDAGAAADTARRHHGDVVGHRPGRLVDPAAGRLKGFAGDRAALVERDGKTLVAASTVPLRANGRATDLTLRDHDGEYRSENPVVAATIAKRLADGIRLPDSALSFLAAAGAADVEPTLLEGKAFWANALTDADVIVAPTTGGVETLVQLRSEASPEQVRMPFELPEGAVLREQQRTPNGFEVVDGDEQLAFVSRPTAVDADGFPVALETRVQGNELVIDVAHRGADVAYPVMVDPYVYGMWRSGSGFEPWRVSQPAGQTQLQNHAGDWYLGRGLYTWNSTQNGWYNHNDASLWYAMAPGNSWIDRAEFHYLTKDPEGSTCTMVAIWHATLGMNPTHWDCLAMTHNSRTLTRPASGTGPYGAVLQTHMSGSSARNHTMTYLGGSIFYYSDGVPPTPVNHNAPSGWSSATRYLQPYAADAGAGVKYVEIASPDGAYSGLTYRDTHGCTGDQSSYCPSSWYGSQRNTASLPEGEILVEANAGDLIGWGQTSGRTTIKTDRTPPQITPSGALMALAGKQVTAVTALRVETTDGVAPVNGTLAERLKSRSGVTSVEMLVDGLAVDATMPGVQRVTQSCPAGNCGWTGDLSLDPAALSEGRHTVQVRAVDAVGKSGLSSSFDIYVDRSGPAIELSGPLYDARGAVTNEGYLTVTATDGVGGGTAAQQGSGVKTIEIRRDGTLINTPPTQTCPAHNCSLTHTNRDSGPDGAHTYLVTAIDQVGNASSSSFTTTVDRTFPSIPQMVPYHGASWTRDFGYELSSSDTGSGVKLMDITENEAYSVWSPTCSGPATAPCPSSTKVSKHTSTLGEGENFLTVQAQDAVGNMTDYVQRVVKIDRTGPALTLSGAGTTTPWPSASTKIHVVATDGVAPDDTSLDDRMRSRSGVKTLELYVDGAQVRTMNGTQLYDVACPAGNCGATVDLDLDPLFLSEGPHTVTVKGHDMAGNVRDSQPIAITVDRTQPTLTLGGQLHQATTTSPGATLSPGNYELVIDAADTATGAASVEVLVDGQRQAYERPTCASPCAMNYVWIMHTDGLAPGGHTVEVIARDGSGNARSQSLSITTPDDSSSTARTGGLERYFQYRSIPTGAGTEALVNTGNGNLVWHHRPIYNRGRGLSTSVQLTYNSLGTIEDLGHGYNELGDGFSLGISSLTRINEPIDLRAMTRGIITVTDADGTVHRFYQNASTGKWTSAALKVHLRRYESATASNKFWAATRPDGTTYFFDRCGYQRTVEDRHGNKLEYVYNPAPPSAEPGDCLPQQAAARPKLVEVLDAHGSAQRAAGTPVTQAHKVTLRYWPESAVGKAGRIQDITDHGGRVLAFDYEPGQGANNGRLKTLTEAAGTADARSFAFEYEISGRDKDLVKITDPLGKPTTFVYNDDHSMGQAPLYELGERLKQSQNRRLKTTSYEYQDLFADTPHDTKVTDARAKVWLYGADALRRPIHGTDPLGTTTDISWDTGGNLISLTDAAGTTDATTTTMSYNANGLLENRTDAEGRYTDWNYRHHNGVHEAPMGGDAGGTFVSDLELRISPRNGRTAFVVEDDGDVREKTDPLGYRTQWDYTATGLLSEERRERERGKFAVTTFSDFDENGLPQLLIDARGNATADTTADGRWKMRYDAVGNVTDVTDPRGTTEPSRSVAREPYTREFVYDNLDLLTLERIPKRSAMQQWIERTRDYDRNDNLISERDGNLKTTTRTYTPMDRLEKMTTPPVPHEGEASEAPEENLLQYDEEENLIQHTGAIGLKSGAAAGADTMHLTYDAAGRAVVQEQRQVTAISSERKSLFTSLGYDRRGNVKVVVDPIGNQLATDATGALNNVASTALHRSAYEYDRMNRQITSIEDPAGKALTTRFGYDESGNLVCIADPRGAKSVASCAAATTHKSRFVYDLREQRTSAIDARDRETAFELRGDGQLASITSPRGTASKDNDPNVVSDLDVDFQTRFEYDAEGELLSRSVPWAPEQYGSKDWKWTFKRNAVGDPETITDPRGNAFTNKFLDSGQLEETTRPGYWTYDASAGVVRPRGSGDPAVNGDPEPRTSASADASGDFGKASPQPRPDWLPKAGRTTFTYDDELQLRTITDAAGMSWNRTTIDRDALGRITRVTSPYGRRPTDEPTVDPSRFLVEERTYDRHGNLRKVLDAVKEGTVAPTLRTRMTFEYDQFDRRTARISPGSAAPETTRYTLDPNGNLDFVTTPRNTVWDYGYDSVDRQTSVRDPLGNLTKKDYDDAGNLSFVQSPRGHGSEWNLYSTFMSYTSANELSVLEEGRTVAGASEEDRTTRFFYDADGNQTQADAPGAKASAAAALTRRVTRRVYDASGRVYSKTTGAGTTERTTVTEYDGNGNLRRVVNPAGVSRATERPRQPARSTEELPTATSDWNEHATVHAYDADNLRTGTYLPWGQKSLHGTTHTDGDRERWRTRISRDDRGRIGAVYPPYKMTDPEPTPTLYRHYENGWVLKSVDSFPTNDDVDAKPHALLYDYDSRGNQTLWKSTDGRDRDVTRSYYPNDLAKSRSARSYATNGSVVWPQARDSAYAYDPNGSLIKVDETKYGATEADKTTRTLKYEYDNADRQALAVEGADQHTKYAYDPSGNVTTRWTDGTWTGATWNDPAGVYKDGKRTTFGFDPRERESTMAVDHLDSAGAVKAGTARSRTSSYYPSHDVKTRTRTRPGTTNIVETRYFADDGRLLEILRQRGTTVLPPSQKYTYDDAGNDTETPSVWGNGNREKDERGQYVYNARNQAARWTDSAGFVTDYALNGSGAIRRKTAGGVSTNYTYVGGRITDAVTGSTTLKYRYDPFGALKKVEKTIGSTTTTDREYAYDAFERLTGVSKDGAVTPTVTYTYDPLDRRETKTAGTEKVDYRYVGSTERLSREVTRNSGTVTTTTSNNYDYDSALQSVGQARTDEVSAFDYRSFAHDASGSTLGLERSMDGAFDGGAYGYDPYGDSAEPAKGSAAANNALRFQGFAYDSAAELYDMHARSYSPKIGRFLTADRYEGANEDVGLQLNPGTSDRYTLLGGDPVNQVEADGHDKYDSWHNEDMEGGRANEPGHGLCRACEKLTEVKSRPDGVGMATYAQQTGRTYRTTTGHTLGANGVAYRSPEQYQPTPKSPHADAPLRMAAQPYPTDTATGGTECLANNLDGDCALYRKNSHAQNMRFIKGFIKAVDTISTVTGVAGVGKFAVKQCFKRCGKLVGGGGDDAARGASRQADAAPGCRTPGSSFVAGTPVLMADGSMRPINRIEVDDVVLATDPLSRQTRAARVTATLQSAGTKQLALVTIGGQPTIATQNHPYWSESAREWVPAGKLKPDDVVLRANGSRAVVSAVSLFSSAGTRVHNLTVEGVHTYYAGRSPVLVHNSGVDDEACNLVDMANEVRTAGDPIAARMRTIAVGEDASGGLWAGSSNGFDPGMRGAALARGITCVRCAKGSHAEENLMREVDDLRRVGTSKRDPCGPDEHNCRQQLLDRGIEIVNDGL